VTDCAHVGAPRLFIGLAGLTIALASPCAHAQISAQIPADCGGASGAALEREIRARLPESARNAPVAVTIAPSADGFQLVVLAAGERRELADRACPALTRAAVVVALALVAPEVQTSSTPATPAPPSAPPNPKISDYRIAIAAEAGAHFGTTPSAALLLGLDAQLAWQRFGLALGLRYLSPTSVRDSTNHGVRADALGATFAGTFTPWARLQARAGVVAYRLAGQGLGSVNNTDDSAWDVGLMLGVHFLPLVRPPFWTALAAEGQLNLARARFSIHESAGDRQVFRAAVFSGSTFLQAGVVW